MSNADRFLFEFYEDDEGAHENDFVLRICRGISEEETLFDEYSKRGQFPYFGRNWDALLDCISDFSWISAPCVWIVHDDLPLKGSSGCRSYLEVLGTAIHRTRRHNDPELHVQFPADVREEIEEVLRS
jgi:hypothetical protein